MNKKFISNKQKEIAIGYCHNKIHYGKITKEAFKEHECLKKQCKFFQIYEDAHYWVSYFNDIKKKKVRKIYAKNKSYYFCQRGISIDRFCELCRSYYGSWTKVPYNSRTNVLDISEFLESLVLDER